MSSSTHPNNTSPIRKQLAKRMVSYYDQLSNSKVLDRSRSGSKERSPSRSMSRSKSKDLGNSRMSNTKGSGANEGELYEDTEHRRVKLHKLKELMVNELERGEGDGALDPDFETLERLHKGYPSFMKHLETEESMLQDNHGVNVKVFLKSKVEDFDKPPEEDSYDSAEEDFVPESPSRSMLLAMSKLYHIVVDQKLERSNTVTENAFDFHQRKAKEIRRLQYAAGVGKKTELKPKAKITYYAVWVLINGEPIPGYLGTDGGFETNQKKDTLVINEDDTVHVKPRKDNKGAFGDINGKIKKPTSDEPECDFIAETEDGSRHPIWITYREPKKVEQAPVQQVSEDTPIEKVQAAPPRRSRSRKLANTNCSLVDPKTEKKLGRAKAELVGKDSVTGNQVGFSKGVLLDSANNVSVILFKRLSDNECIIKTSAGDQTLEEITDSEKIEDLDSQLVKHSLKKSDDDNGAWPKEVYLYEGPLVIEALKVFDEEFINASCENNVDYQGKTEWKNIDGNEDAGEDAEGELYINYRDSLGRKDKVRIVFDNDNEDKLRMGKLMEYLLTIAKLRVETTGQKKVTKSKKTSTIELGELRFDIVDKKGRKIKIMIKNDSDNESVDESDEGEPEAPLESAYYHLMVENQKVIPYARREKKAIQQETTIEDDVDINKKAVKVVAERYQIRSQVVEHRRLPRQEATADRAVLSKIASHQGLKFANDQQFEAFLNFVEALPEEIDRRKAINQYKEMMEKIMG